MTSKSGELAAALATVMLVLAILYFGLAPSVLVGTLLLIAIRGLERHLPGQGRYHRLISLLISVGLGAAVLAGIVLAGSKLLGAAGLSGMLLKASSVLEQLRAVLPESWQNYIPDGADQLKTVVALQLKHHAASITQMSVHGFHQLVHLILATIIACLLGASEPREAQGTLTRPLYRHLRNFGDAVAKVFGAQFKVAAVNTLVTGVFLLLVLPQLGYRIPFADMAVALAFVLGLIPVVGNLLSNTLIVLLSLSVSPWLAVGALGFLVVSHKLEYLLCARFVGSGIGAKTWELLTSMVLLESIFGPIGFAMAPVLYAWLKTELRQRDLL